VLHEFLSSNRATLIERCRSKAALRPVIPAPGEAIAHGVPVFLDQVIRTLQLERTHEPAESRKVSGLSGGGDSGVSEIGVAARRHAHELFQRGFPVDLVVHDYGDLCQAITDLAVEVHVPIEADDFRTLNRCLDNAIANSMTAYVDERDLLVISQADEAFQKHFSDLTHGLRDLIDTATRAMTVIKTRQVDPTGPTGALLESCLARLGALVDRSLPHGESGVPISARQRLISAAEFISDVGFSATLEAQSRGCNLKILPVDARLAMNVDRNMLFLALQYLLQSTFQFAARGTTVRLSVYGTADRICIEIEDHSGGLTSSDLQHLSGPFPSVDSDSMGLASSLRMCQRRIEANDGALRVLNMPHSGCVVSVNLPRHLLSETFFRV
jgi:hypothetical protein